MFAFSAMTGVDLYGLSYISLEKSWNTSLHSVQNGDLMVTGMKRSCEMPQCEV